jgi:hypothetical protein
MPPSIARSEPAPDRLLAPGFIIALSAACWTLLFHAARYAASFAG